MKVKNIIDLGTMITLTGYVDYDMLKQFDAGAQRVLEKEGEKKATILISTTGGRVNIGDALAERIRFLSGFVDLRVIAATFVMSSGVRVFLALPRERRFITPGGMIMIHSTTREEGASSPVSLGERERALREDLLDIQFDKQREGQWIQQLAREMGMKYPTVKKLWHASHRFTAKEAVERGLAASIISF